MKNDVLAVEPVDPATAAFQRLEGEIAVLRRAVERTLPRSFSGLLSMARPIEATNLWVPPSG